MRRGALAPGHNATMNASVAEYLRVRARDADVVGRRLDAAVHDGDVDALERSPVRVTCRESFVAAVGGDVTVPEDVLYVVPQWASQQHGQPAPLPLGAADGPPSRGAPDAVEPARSAEPDDNRGPSLGHWPRRTVRIEKDLWMLSLVLYVYLCWGCGLARTSTSLCGRVAGGSHRLLRAGHTVCKMLSCHTATVDSCLVPVRGLYR